MSEHELTEEKIAELWDASQDKSTFFDDLGLHSKNLFSSFARAAYDLGKQAATGDLRTGWTDDELRAAIREAVAALPPISDFGDASIDYARNILTALGIDHQPKPELPDTPGSVIYDVVDAYGNELAVLTLDHTGDWCGVNSKGYHRTCPAGTIVSFGGVLDLDKVRGEQGE